MFEDQLPEEICSKFERSEQDRLYNYVCINLRKMFFDHLIQHDTSKYTKVGFNMKIESLMIEHFSFYVDRLKLDGVISIIKNLENTFFHCRTFIYKYHINNKRDEGKSR